MKNSSHWIIVKASRVRPLIYLAIALSCVGSATLSWAGRVTPLPVGGGPINHGGHVEPLPIPTDHKKNGERWVMAEGYADMTSGKRVARKQALLDAYRKAINAGGSIEISEYSELRNFKDVVDIVTKKSHGYIRKYEILADGPKADNPTRYFVAIRALVVDKLDRRKDGDDVLRQLVALMGTPRVLFILSEKPSYQKGYGSGSSANDAVDVRIEQGDTKVSMTKRSNSKTNSGAEGSADEGEFAFHSSELEMAKRFRDVGYEVLTSDDVLDRGFVSEKELRKARQGLGSYAAKVGRAANVDIVISGVVKYGISSSSGGTDIHAHIGTVSLHAKAIIPSSGRVLNVASTRQSFMAAANPSELLAKEESIARAAKIAGDQLKWEIPTLLANDTRDIELVLSSIDYNSAVELKRYIASLSGVQSVEMQGWAKEKTIYIVKNIYTGPREPDLIASLKDKHKGIKVLDVGYCKVNMKYGG